MTRRKFIVFASFAVALSVLLSSAALLAFDLYLHAKFEKMAGLNRWGYRGPVVGRKQPGETRIVVIGGSTALGYGQPWDLAFPALLELKLNDDKRRGRVSVVNLGINNAGAYSFKYTLQDYEYLDSDVVCLYEGYNDIGGPNLGLFRHETFIFTLTGYYPIFPVILSEKAMALRTGDLGAAYRGDKVVFTPTVSQKTRAAAMEAVLAVHRSLEQQVKRLSRDTSPGNIGTRKTDGWPNGYPWPDDGDLPCDPGPTATGRWSYIHYCRSIAVATDYALGRGKRVMIITQPYLGKTHTEQQQRMAAMLSERYGNTPKVAYVNLGNAIDMTDPKLVWDGMHMTSDGNERVAASLVTPMREFLKQ